MTLYLYSYLEVIGLAIRDIEPIVVEVTRLVYWNVMQPQWNPRDLVAP